jgi:hypothetical protein
MLPHGRPAQKQIVLKTKVLVTGEAEDFSDLRGGFTGSVEAHDWRTPRCPRWPTPYRVDARSDAGG